MPNTITPRIKAAMDELTEAIDEHLPDLRQAAREHQGGYEIAAMLGTIKNRCRETIRLTGE